MCLAFVDSDSVLIKLVLFKSVSSYCSDFSIFLLLFMHFIISLFVRFQKIMLRAYIVKKFHFVKLTRIILVNSYNA